MRQDFFKVKVFFLSVLALGGSIFISTSVEAAVPYQLPITVYNATSTLTDYQVKVTFQPNEFNFAQASSTGADIYFTDASSSTINHFIQTFSNSGTSTIWVKVPELVGQATTTIYMHYGDVTATSTHSNATGTFLFFDNFDNGSIADWATSSLDVDQESENATVVAGTDKFVSPYYSAKLSAAASCASFTYNGATAVMTKSLNIGAGSYKIDFNLWQQIPNFRYFTSAWLTSSVKVNGAEIWSDSPGCSGMGCTYDGAWGERSMVASGTIDTLAFSNYASDCTDSNMWVDDLRIRKYDAVEPVVTFTPVITTYTLTYSADIGGSVTGEASQTVNSGSDGSAVTAVPALGYRFVRWSDNTTVNPRIDREVSGDVLIDAIFERVYAGGSAIIVLPPGVGSGVTDTVASTLGTMLNVGTITSLGTNVLTYINNLNSFLAPESSNGWQLGGHSFQITNLDLSNYIATLVISSQPQTISIKKLESRAVDLDGDKINDVNFTFANTYVNRAEITMTSLTKGSTTVTNPVTPAEATKFIFKKNLSLGTKNADVKELQKFLNANGFVVARSGVGSLNQETNYFGSATKNALIKFQKAKGVKPASGLFGFLTRVVVNK